MKAARTAARLADWKAVYLVSTMVARKVASTELPTAVARVVTKVGQLVGLRAAHLDSQMAD